MAHQRTAGVGKRYRQRWQCTRLQFAFGVGYCIYIGIMPLLIRTTNDDNTVPPYDRCAVSHGARQDTGLLPLTGILFENENLVAPLLHTTSPWPRSFGEIGTAGHQKMTVAYTGIRTGKADGIG